VQSGEPSIEATGRTVDEAVDSALARLGMTEDQVEVTVLSQGNPGRMFGFGAEPARVRVSPLPGAVAMAAPPYAPDDGDEDEDEEELVEDAADVDVEEEVDEEAVENGEAAEEAGDEAAAEDEEDGDELPADIAADLLQEMLDLMEIEGEVEITGDEPPTLNVVGADLSLLIGRRGEHLRAIQFLLNLMANKQLTQRQRIVVDVQNYREHRTELLQGMARRAADQVRQRGVPVILEPMPPNERRIVHMTLAEDPDVMTESIYEDEKRRVVIKPRRRQPTQR
jgi:spoIIIJ-associated protein